MWRRRLPTASGLKSTLSLKQPIRRRRRLLTWRMWNSIPLFAIDASFFSSLNRIVQSEPWLDRDRAMIDVLRSIGIEKGKPFNPDKKTKAALEAGAREAHAWLEAILTPVPPFYAASHWTVPALPELVAAAQASFDDPDKYPVDARGFAYSYAYIGIKRLGTGQFYPRQRRFSTRPGCSTTSNN